MLENNFNKLDNDYITVMSKFLINKNSEEVLNNIEKLAELGQVNAQIAYYYMLNDNQKANSHINALVDEAPTNSYSNLLAKASKLFKLEEQNLYNDLKSEYKKIVDEFYYADYKASSSVFHNAYWSNRRDQYGKALENVNEKIDNLKYLKIVDQSYKLACLEYKNSKNTFVLQSVCDIIKTNSIRYNFIKNWALENELKRQLLKLYKANPNNPLIAFSLAKEFFDNSSKKQSLKSKIILEELSTRPLSGELENYKLKGLGALKK